MNSREPEVAPNDFYPPYKAALCGVIFFFVAFVSCAHAQSTPSTGSPKPTPVPAVVTVSKGDNGGAIPIPAKDPLDSDRAVFWSLRTAILTALANNVDIEIERRNLKISEYNLLAAQGYYEPVFSASPSFNSTRQPNISRITSLTTSQQTVSTQTATFNAGLQKPIQFGGGLFQTSFDNTRSTSNNAIASPLYTPQLSFSYTQPLWRNRSIDSGRLQILVAKKTLTLTDSQFRQQVISTIYQVQQAYWNLALAQRNVSVQNDGVELAQKLVDDNQKQVDVGMLAPLDVVTAKATLETRRQSLFQAKNAATQAQNALKSLVVEGTQSNIWNQDINPTDLLEEREPGISLDDSLTNAYANRPEIEQFKTQADIDQLNVKYYRNQTKPQIDLVSSYSATGVGGSPVSTLTCPTGTILGSNGLCSPGNIPPTVTTTNINSNFVGGYGTSLGNLATNRYNTVTVGLTISLPLHNKTAEANLGRALEEAKMTDLQQRKQMQTIEADVRSSYQAVVLAKQNLDAARLARQYAETQLDGEQKKFASGLSTTFLVLTRQNDLIQARGAEINGLSAYNNAISALQQATGTTLTSNNVEIK